MSTWSGGRLETTAVWTTSGRGTTRRWTRTRSTKANKGKYARMNTSDSDLQHFIVSSYNMYKQANEDVVVLVHFLL